MSAAPGPWVIREDGLYLRIAHGEHRTTVANGVVSEANAHLIAAAPELLAALKDAIGALEFSRDYHSDLSNAEQAMCQDRLDAAVRAIAKATAA